MFRPPRCPYRRCTNHKSPATRFYHRKGYYRAKCRPRPVPRFQCLGCGRYFSRQTFRADYRDHRPELNERVFELIASGVGLRQTSRILGLSLRCTELKFRKIARHLRRINVNLRGPLRAPATLQMDEFETYEGRRGTRPLSVPVLIERRSRFIVWAESATIRPRGKMTERRRRAIEEDERRFGRRVDLSRRALRRTLARGVDLTGGLRTVFLETDEKSSYPGLAVKAFGAHRLVHRTTIGKAARNIRNPLFPINQTEAMARDLMGRLRRESWLVSKKRRYLDLALHVFAAFRNYVRRRFNRDEDSPAQLLGFVDRRMTFRQLLGWRQDWGGFSPHPLGAGARTVLEG